MVQGLEVRIPNLVLDEPPPYLVLTTIFCTTNRYSLGLTSHPSALFFFSSLSLLFPDSVFLPSPFFL